MSNTPLPLYQVLAEEYNCQKSGPPITVQNLQEKREKLNRRFWVIEDKEARLKKIDEAMLAEFYSWLHQNNVKRSALCFSGGGIRSATFGLGVLQGIARNDLLSEFDFLSTVSGGGYLGGWLSAWIHRRGLLTVQRQLGNLQPPASPLRPESEPIRHLRAYSNYMSPKLGLLSADTWTLVSIFLRNLFLNWLVLIPLMLAMLMIPRLCVAIIATRPEEWVSQIAFWLAVTSGAFGIGYIFANRPSMANHPGDGSSFPEERKSQGWFLVYCLIPISLLAALITTYYAWLPASIAQLKFNVFGVFELPPRLMVFAFMAFGVMLHLGGMLVAKRWVKKFNHWEKFIHFSTGIVLGLLTWVAAKQFFPQPSLMPDAAYYVCFAAPLFLMLCALAATIFVGLSSYYTTDADREWLARGGAWILIASLVWCVVSSLVIFGPILLMWSLRTIAPVGGISGLVTLILGNSSKTPANNKSKADQKKTFKGSVLTSVVGFILPLAAAIFAAFIVAVLSLGTSWLIKGLVDFLNLKQQASFRTKSVFSYAQLDHLRIFLYSPSWLLLALMISLAGFGVFMGFFINVNKFSLHAAYRDRLIRAYLGASKNTRDRRPNKFTGFDEKDNLQMHELQTHLFYQEDINDLSGLAKKLNESQLNGSTDAVSQFVYKRLLDSTRDLLNRYTNSLHSQSGQNGSTADAHPVSTSEVLFALVNDLNCLIQDSSMHENACFANAKLPEIVQELRVQRPVVETLRLNRALLEIAYPDALRPAEACKPLHVVNMTLNLVSGENLAWQNRKAESFTASALHCGSYAVGYRRSGLYGLNRDLTPPRAISLGTAAAISGAAASPNMGYYSSPMVTFLMALFNVRLGWWLGNPGVAGKDTFNLPGPRFAARPFIAEALGLTNDRHPYVYLSDGGHFENFGLYEMVLRRCHFIVVSDGSADPDYDYEGLGNAISKIRVDLGVPIKFENYLVLPKDDSGRTGIGTDERTASSKHRYCAIARICYSCVDKVGPSEDRPPVEDGYLIYIKSTLGESEPIDVYHYARAHIAFPHESTGDQMYSESQFESYRELGSHTFERICGSLGKSFKNLDEFFEAVKAKAGDPPACA